MHFCGNRCGSENRPQNRSGPALVLAATEAFGGMSSKDSRVTLTLTPVALVKASSSATNASSSDCTKYFQRNKPSCAPFSGFQGAACAQALLHSSSAGPASAPVAASEVAPFTRVRRVNMVMALFPPLSRVETSPAWFVEQMRQSWIWLEPDLVARFEVVAFAEHRDDVVAAELGGDLQFGAGRLDHQHLGFGAVVGDDEVLRPNAIDDGMPVAAVRRRQQRQTHAVGALEFQPAVGVDPAIEEIHRRRADEARDEQVLRPVVKLERRADLFHQAVMHDHDAVGERHGLDLIVGDVDGRSFQALMQFLDFGAHGDAKLGVEIRQRLVEQEHLRIAHDGAAHGDALALAAGELARIAAEQGAEAENIGGPAHALLDLALRCAAQHEREAHIGGDGHVRIERVVLKHHGNVALLRRHAIDDALADADFAGGDVLEPSDHPQQGRLAASRGSHEHDEFAVVDEDVDAVDDLDRSKGLSDVADRDRSHGTPPVARALPGAPLKRACGLFSHAPETCAPQWRPRRRACDWTGLYRQLQFPAPYKCT